MSQLKITRNNLVQTLESTLSVCRSQMEQAMAPPANDALIRDLEMAVQALEGILLEIRGERPQRTRRSSLFTRYVIDEEQRMVMNPELRDMIVKIEDVYARR